MIENFSGIRVTVDDLWSNALSSAPRLALAAPGAGQILVDQRLTKIVTVDIDHRQRPAEPTGKGTGSRRGRYNKRDRRD